MSSAVNSTDIASLVSLFEASGWDELDIDVNGLQLHFSKHTQARSSPLLPASERTLAPVKNELVRVTEKVKENVQPGWIAIAAPNLGTFYRSPKPGAPHFVELGQCVDVDTEVCLLEVMKLFTAVKAGVSGKVAQICVNDGDMVESNQTLFYVDPL